MVSFIQPLSNRDIVLAKDRSLLYENGGHIQIHGQSSCLNVWQWLSEKTHIKKSFMLTTLRMKKKFFKTLSTEFNEMI